MVLISAVLASFKLAVAISAPPTGPSAEQAVRYAELYQEARTRLSAPGGGEVLELFKEAKSIYDLDGDLHYRLGQAQLAAKDYPAAIASYERAIELGAFAPKYRANCLYDMACAYSLQGNVAKGFETLEKSMAAGWRDLDHLRNDADLANLRTDPRWETLAAAKDVSKMSRDEGFRYDLWLLDREMRRVHFNPYRFHTPAELDQFVKDLDARIPKLTDAQIYVEFMKYSVLLGDGHTSARLPAGSPLLAAVPIQAFCFDDGVFVTAAAPAVADLVGAQILAVEGKSIEEIKRIQEPTIWRDNPQGIKAFIPGRIILPALSHALGYGKSATETTFTIKDSNGKTRDVTLKTAAGGADATWVTARKGAKLPDPLYLKNRTKSYYYELLPDGKTAYLQYNSVRSDPTDPMPDFCKKMFDEIDAKEIENLIVDVRWNGGGNSFLNRNIQDGILARPKLNRQGHFFLITGRNTFSAAQNFTTDLVRNANPILVGEPTGSSPNFVGETIRLTLPYTKVQCSISDLYWQRSWPMDHRIWLAPQLPAPPVFALYKENRDPAMEAILAFLKKRN